MSENTCAERISERMASRAADIGGLLEREDDEARDELWEMPLSVDAQTTLKVLLSTGGPGDWLEVPIERATFRWEISGPVSYHFQDWFDHAEQVLCPMHADQDPCYRMAMVTGTRRKGSIVRGVCSACGWSA